MEAGKDGHANPGPPIEGISEGSTEEIHGGPAMEEEMTVIGNAKCHSEIQYISVINQLCNSVIA